MTKARPIIFSAPMVRALLEGRKTQTRRVVKIDHNDRFHGFYPDHRSVKVRGGSYVGIDEPGLVWRPYAGSGIVAATSKELADWSPYGKPGERLWVREAWRSHKVLDDRSGKKMAEECIAAGWKTPWAALAYESDGHKVNWDTFGGNRAPLGRYRHARFMPRWASRITLEITDVRVQRLQDISEEDAQAEGVERWVVGDGWREYGLSKEDESVCGPPMPTARDSFRALWESINGSGNWGVNPWIWSISLRRIEPAERAA